MYTLCYLLLLLLVSALSCDPDEFQYSLNIVYGEEAASQSVTIYESNSTIVKYSFNGYGKDNTVSMHPICLETALYSIVARDGLKPSWPTDSHFSILSSNQFEILRGTCDCGYSREYSLYPYQIVLPFSNWRFDDGPVDESWIMPSYDDSYWREKVHGDFPPFTNIRYYRLQTSVYCAPLLHSGVVMFALYGRNVSSLYANGISIYENINTGISITFDGINTVNQYSIPATLILRHCSSTTQSLTLAAVTSSIVIDEHESDLFDLVIYTIPSDSSRIINGIVSSEHWRDFLSNPLMSSVDGYRMNEWKVKGNQADFVFTMNNHRYEYLNTYRITCSKDDISKPVSWIVYGCNEYIHNWNCDEIDRKNQIHWNGSYLTKTYSMNSKQRSYQRYSIDFMASTLASELWISECSFDSRQLSPLISLTYQYAHQIILNDIEIIHNEPISPGYSQFIVQPLFPPSIQFDLNSGVFHGIVNEKGKTQFTIRAIHQQSNEISTTVIIVESIVCENTHRIVEIQWFSYLHSSFEEWRLITDNRDVIAFNHGQDCGSSTIKDTLFLCLPIGLYHIQQRINTNHLSQSFGHLHLSMSLPSNQAYSNQSMYSIFTLPFSDCSSDWSNNTNNTLNHLLNCSMISFTTSLLINGTDIWRCTIEGHVDPRWMSVDYEEDDNWFSTTLKQLTPFSSYRLRYQLMMMTSLMMMSSVELIIINAIRFTVYINGILINDITVNYVIEGHTMLLNTNLFNNSINLIAIRIQRIYQSLLTPIIIIQPIHSSSSYWDLYNTILTASNTLPGYHINNLIDNNIKTEWKGIYKNGIVSIRAEFLPIRSQMIKGYCLTVSQMTMMYSPSSWQLRGRTHDRHWYTLSELSSIHFSYGEHRCFVIYSRYQNLLLTAVEIVFLSRSSQSSIQLCEISFHSFSVDHIPIPSFHYGTQSIPVIIDIDFPPLSLPHPFYSFFSTRSSLPPGLLLDTGDGHLWGKVKEPFDEVDVIIIAIGPQGNVNTTINLQWKSCVHPMSLVSLELTHLDDVFSFLSFYLSTSNQHPIAYEFIPSSSSSSPTRFSYCVTNGDYHLSFSDRSNAGFLKTTYSIFSDTSLVHSGFFNPGFSNQHLTFFAGSILPASSTLWYYSVDDEEPKKDWFKKIDPIIETWKVARPGEFPAPIGHAQYYKTVLEIGDMRPMLIDFVSFMIDLRVCGGAIVYINGKEVLRHQLYTGHINKDSLPFSSFIKAEMISIETSVQFTSIQHEVVVIAVEIHDELIQTTNNFLLSVRLIHNESPCRLKGDVTINHPNVDHLSSLLDNQYYNKMTVHGSCDDVEVIIDLNKHSYRYLTQLCLFTANTPGEYPHSIGIDGGRDDGNITWIPLYSTNEVSFKKVEYGQFSCFHFFNDQSYSLFQLHFADCEHKNNLEVAEIEFYSKRLDGYCEDEDGSLKRTPNGQWKDFGCPDLYIGKRLLFCEMGKWDQTMNQCKPKAPVAFKYKSNVFYISRRRVINIVPSVLGAEVIFKMNSLPEGLLFNNMTGSFTGVYTGRDVVVKVTVYAMNSGGYQTTSLAFYVMNNNEELLMLIALLAVALLVAAFTYIWILLKTSNEKVEKEAEMSHVHTKLLPKNILPLLV